jgi:hypothetical protein
MIKKLTILLITLLFCSCSNSGLNEGAVIECINEVWNKGANNQDFLESILKDGNWIDKIQESYRPVSLNKINSLKILKRGKIDGNEQINIVHTEGNLKLLNRKAKDIYIDKDFTIVVKYYFKKDSFNQWRCIMLYSEQIGFQIVTGKIESSGYK